MVSPPVSQTQATHSASKHKHTQNQYLVMADGDKVLYRVTGRGDNAGRKGPSQQRCGPA